MGKLQQVWAGIKRILSGRPSAAQTKFRLEWSARQKQREAEEEGDGVVAVYRNNVRVPRSKPERNLTGIPYGIVEETIEVARPGTGGTAYEWGPRR